MNTVGIVDVGICNLGSLTAAFSRLGKVPKIVGEPQSLDMVSHVVLPGVGGFGEASKRLRERGFFEGLRLSIESGKPFLGICLGMQLMTETGLEGGHSPGLSIIPGEIAPLEQTNDARVPHVGWNSVSFTTSHPIFRGIPNETDFYFVHGYAAINIPDVNIVGVSNHGIDFPSSIATGSAVGVQFHPEKSQGGGSRLLDNFLNWDGTC